VITGFNTDIEYEGVVYHVQTEDKGVDSPLILTLVYTGGAILASKRVLYDDLIEQGFDEHVLAERLSRQHKLICAAIRAGRLDDLKRMSHRDAETRAAQTVRREVLAELNGTRPEEVAPMRIEVDPMPVEVEPMPVEVDPVPISEPEPPVRHEILPQPPPQTAQSTGGYAGVFEKVNLSKGETSLERPFLELLNERPYKAGDSVSLDIRVTGAVEAGSRSVANAPVGVKILGTTFRPVILSTRTDRDGLATIKVSLPDFSTGRAAILIRAAVNGETVELRRIIQHR
jgi:hypothetical protein